MTSSLSRRKFLANGGAPAGGTILTSSVPVAAPHAHTAFLGNAQIDWLVSGLLNSSATWKVVAADMPIGLYVSDGKDAQGNNRSGAIANGDDGRASGRELEIARFLKNIRRIRNVVWITADVHYCAAHYHDPAQARFNDFSGFWEFVAGR